MQIKAAASSLRPGESEVSEVNGPCRPGKHKDPAAIPLGQNSTETHAVSPEKTDKNTATPPSEIAATWK